MRTALIVLIAVFASSCAFGSLPGQSGHLQEGVYAHTDPYTTEIVELRGGRFRYWFASDVITDSDPHYPLSGHYGLSNDTVILRNPQIYQPRFRFRIFHGVATLWNKMALDYWRKHPKDQQFRTLFKQAYTPEEIWRADFRRRLQWKD